MLFIGVALVAGTLLKHDVIIFQVRDFSWLPICGYVVLAVGLLECFDAAVAKELGDFFLNLQTGVLDVVVGGMIIFSITDVLVLGEIAARARIHKFIIKRV